MRTARWWRFAHPPFHPPALASGGIAGGDQPLPPRSATLPSSPWLQSRGTGFTRALSTRLATAAVVSRREFHYERRRPERTTLYEVVRDYLATHYAASEERFASALPGFVKRELESYLECGLPCRGFAAIDCADPECHARHLLAFSCKGRAFCPSCLGRRMAQTAANLIDHVVPPGVPLRQRPLRRSWRGY